MIDLLAGSVPLEENLSEFDAFEVFLSGEYPITCGRFAYWMDFSSGDIWWTPRSNGTWTWVKEPSLRQVDRGSHWKWWCDNGLHTRQWVRAKPPVEGQRPEPHT